MATTPAALGFTVKSGWASGTDGPWRAEQKMAALGAWLVLAGGVK